LRDAVQANPLGVVIVGLAAIGAYFYYKGQKEREEQAMEAYRERLAAEQEAKRQKILALRAKAKRRAAGAGPATAGPAAA